MSSHHDDDARRALERELAALGEAEPSPEELASLTEPTLLAEHAELLELLRSTRGDAPAPSAHEALLERALSAPELADDAERARAEALRGGLEEGLEREAALLDGARAVGDDDTASLVRLATALSSAHAPAELDPARNEALVRDALARGGALFAARGAVAEVVSLERHRSRGAAKRARVGLGVAGALALAASVALTLVREAPPSRTADVESPASPGAVSPAPPDAKLTRSTAELFDAPFARQGGESARIDRIATARASDLRQNRYAMWGVR